MSKRVLILGAGFGGLELATILAEETNGGIEVTMIDREGSFAPGAATIDLLLGRVELPAVRTGYELVRKPGVRVLREEIEEIDPEARTVRTDSGTHEADVLVVALGAGYELEATPGLAEHGHNLYSVDDTAALAGEIAGFRSGRILIGVCAPRVKCPPAPSAATLLLAEHLRQRGVSEGCQVTLATPAPAPVPPSPEASAALVDEFKAAQVEFLPGRQISSVRPGEAVLSDGSSIPFDLLLGVPKHRAPEVVVRSGLTDGGYIPVDPSSLRTRFAGVYAIGDVADTDSPKAGVFAEDAARTVARDVIAADEEGGDVPPYAGRGSCYLELGQGRVARIDVDTYPEKIDRFNPPTPELAAEKAEFAPSRIRRWFGPSA